MTELSERDIQRIASAVTQKLAHNGHGLGHEQASNIAAAAARTTVQEMSTKIMALLGLDPANAKHLEALKANIAFVQHLRLRSEQIGRSVSNAIANAVAIGLLGLLLLGAVVWFRSGTASAPPAPITIK